MSCQRENAADATSIAIFKARMPQHPENKISGAVILDFEKGFAMSIVGASGLRHPDRAHHFKRIGATLARARCGIAGSANFMYGQGSFPRCRICQRSVDRKP